MELNKRFFEGLKADSSSSNDSLFNVLQNPHLTDASSF